MYNWQLLNQSPRVKRRGKQLKVRTSPECSIQYQEVVDGG